MKKTINRLLAILLAAALLCGILPLSAGAAGVDITAEFTDPAFRAAVYEHIGKTAPESILDTDVAGVTRLDVNSRGIASLAGLEYFSALERLECSYNQISELPALPANLTTLWCWSNQLSALPALPPGLIELHCYYNQLSTLPTLPSSLKVLHCSNNQIMELPVLPPNLEKLACYNNQLSVLPMLLSSLTELSCYNNQLTSLPALPTSLIYLSCSNNELTSLPSLPSDLKQIACQANQLTSLDITGLQLNYLDCSRNNMTSKSDVIGFTGEWDNENFRFYPQNPQIIIKTVLQWTLRLFLSGVAWILWPNWPPALQLVLKTVFFGWLWMRWL